jgi:hypothetical protein
MQHIPELFQGIPLITIMNNFDNIKTWKNFTETCKYFHHLGTIRKPLANFLVLYSNGICKEYKILVFGYRNFRLICKYGYASFIINLYNILEGETLIFSNINVSSGIKYVTDYPYSLVIMKQYKLYTAVYIENPFNLENEMITKDDLIKRENSSLEEKILIDSQIVKLSDTMQYIGN